MPYSHLSQSGIMVRSRSPRALLELGSVCWGMSEASGTGQLAEGGWNVQ